MRAPRSVVLLFVATLLWLPQVQRFHHADRARLREALTERATRPRDVAAMRAVNPEWDFMRRTFTVLALGDRALSAPADARARYVAAMDREIDDVLATEAAHGKSRFLLGYGSARPFVDPEARSVFVDGEIVMMIAARELVAPRPALRAEADRRAEAIERAMRRSPTLSAESYPDECWTFCNTTALAALSMWDAATGSDHDDLGRAWVARARERLLDTRTGILVSSFTRDGVVRDGAEGSSIWMSARNLLLVDEAFARDQYARARRELSVTFLGFAWAREWPQGAPRRPDVDSGPIVPLLDASAGSSAFALLGASAFGDEAYLDGLLASAELAGFPDGAGYRASNDVGDAVLASALTHGPLWARARARRVAEVAR
ncbi:MAG: hypothetical protein R3B36_34350 [Polyangiaceae bacterium]